MNGHGEQIPADEAYYGAVVSAPAAPTATGYDFIGWYEDAKCTVPYTFDTMPLNDKTVYAKWEGKTVKYKVEHYKQSVDGTSYDKVEADTDTLEGRVDGYTAAQAKSYDGFSPKLVVNKQIAAEGETVVELNTKPTA